MAALIISLTGSTCGDACWHAREDVCRCSCGGRNHGCLLSTDGIRPTRMAKIDGQPCTLLATGVQTALEPQAMAANKQAGIPYAYAHTARTHYGYTPAVLMRPATPAQVQRWPELAAWKAAPTGYNDPKPYLLWQATP